MAGSVTNLAFLGALARHAGFAAGDVDTGLIERDLAGLSAAPEATPEVKAAALLEAAALPDAALVGFAGLAGFALWAPLRRQMALRLGEEVVSGVILLADAHHATVELEGRHYPAERRPAGWCLGEAHPPGAVLRAGGMIHVFGRGRHAGAFHFAPIDPLDRAGSAVVAGNLTLSPMPGLVKMVFVAPGQAVSRGDRLAVLEAMKMEHALIAGRDGVVAEVLVGPGAQVEAGAALIRLEEADG